MDFCSPEISSLPVIFQRIPNRNATKNTKKDFKIVILHCNEIDWSNWTTLFCRNESVSCCKYVVLSTAHMDKFLETLALLNIEHRPSQKILSLSEKPTRFKELAKGENWQEIILNTIYAIEENYKRRSWVKVNFKLSYFVFLKFSCGI